MAFLGIGAPAPAGGPRWWDYGFGLLGGNAPSAVNQLWKERAQADEDRQFRQQLMGQAFNMPGGSSAQASSAGGVPAAGGGLAGMRQGAMNEEAALRGEGAPILGAAAQASSPATRSSMMGAMTAGGQGAATGARPGASTANILYNDDGSLRSRQQLLNDPRFVALKMDPKAAALLQTWEAAAEARAPKWDFHNDQYFNTNSDDPTQGSRRVGTGMDNSTGIYTEVGPNGQVIARSAQGFNPAIAAVTTAKANAQNASDVAKYGAQKGIDLEIDPRIAAAKAESEARIRQQYEPTTAARIAGAQEAARAPYTMREVQTMDGPATMTTAQAIAAANSNPNGGIRGRSAGQIADATKNNELDLNAIRELQRTNSMFGDDINNIKAGKLDLGPVSNFVNNARNSLSMSSPESRNFEQFQSNRQSFVAATQQLQSGTQTDADARRYLAQLGKDTDEKTTMQIYQRLVDLNNKAIAERQARIRGR